MANIAIGKVTLYKTLLFLLPVFLLIGCAPPVVRIEDTSLCKGKGSIEAAIAEIDARREKLSPLKAYGKTTISWYDEKQKKQSETCDTKILFYGPHKLLFYGSSLIGEAIWLGTNEEEFWLRLKPKEISSFFMGKRELAENCSNDNWINPEIILEALGVVNVDDTWQLSNVANQDIFTKAIGSRLIKKVYVNACDYRIQRIEYFDDGKIVLTTDLSEYNDSADGLSYPKEILIQGAGNDGLGIEVRLKTVKPYLPEDKELNGRLFKIPSSRGFDNIYELGEDCEFLEIDSE